MANRTDRITNPTARTLLAQLIRKQLLPVPVPHVSGLISGDGSEESPLTIPDPLAIAHGGTGGTSSPAAGGVAYGNGSKHCFTAAGVAGQLLQSNGAGAPSWLTPTPGPGLRVLDRDVETSLDTAGSVDDVFRWSLRGGEVLSLQAWLTLVGASNSAPRLALSCGGEYASGKIRVMEWITSATVPVWQHININTLTTANTSTGLDTPTVWEVAAMLLATDDCDVELQFAGSRTVATEMKAGSFALFNILEA